MDPINESKQGCVPTSSNCVIWQGPDLDCIKLCKGDTITVVVAKLATELCSILEKLNVSTYDISCFNLGNCGPKEFTDLIQLLIDKICALEQITPSSGGSSTGDGLNTVINICPEFYYITPEGDTARTMTVYQYVLAIGNKVCGLVGQINTINQTLAAYDQRISDLENAPVPSVVIPAVPSVCIFPGSTPNIDVLMAGLEEAFCELRLRSGLPADILASINAAQNFNNSPKLYGQGNMSTIPGWFVNPLNLAQSFSNLWKVVSDMRASVAFMAQNCCASGSASIGLTMDSSLDGSDNLIIIFGGTLYSNIIDGPVGSTITITDQSGHSYNISNVFVKSNYYTPNIPLSIPLASTPINTDDELNITLNGQFADEVSGSTYSIILTDSVITGTCPTITVTPSHTTVDWAFVWPGSPAIVSVELLNGLGNVLQSQALTITTPSQNGSFVGLNWGANYSIRLIVNAQPCSNVAFSTDSYVCAVPLIQAPTYDYTKPEGSQKGNTIEAWQILYDANH